MNKMQAIISGAALLAISGMAAQAEPPKIELGKPFPDLLLPSMEDGSPTSIADFRGRKLILHVFASW